MRILLALFIAALVVMGTPAKNIHNSTSSPKKQTVQSETWRNMSTLVYEQEKDLTKQQVSVEPEEKEAVAPVETVKPQQPAPQPLTDHEQLMQQAGISPQDWNAVDYIISHESGWRPTVLNSEGCVGLGQRCPAATLYADCPDLDPVCQLRHFTNYAVSRYGSWQSAYNAWVGKGWW